MDDCVTPTCYVAGSAYTSLVLYELGLHFDLRGEEVYHAPAGLARDDPRRAAAEVLDEVAARHPLHERRWRIAASLPDAAPLLLRLCSAGASVELMSPTVLDEIGCQRNRVTGVLEVRQLATALVNAIPASRGGPAPADASVFLLAQIADRLFHKGDAVVADLVRQHPIWPALAFFRGICPEYVGRFMVHIGDPRWFAHAVMLHDDDPYEAMIFCCTRGLGLSPRPYFDEVFRKRTVSVAVNLLKRSKAKGSGPEWTLLKPLWLFERVAETVGLLHRAWLATTVSDERLALELLSPERVLPGREGRLAYLQHLRVAGFIT